MDMTLHRRIISGNTEELIDYIFNTDEAKYAILLGNCCIYNHSEHYNATYRYNEAKQAVVFRARCPIIKGEEIFISYGDNWFSSRDLLPTPAPFRYKVYRFLRSIRVLTRGLFITALLMLLMNYFGTHG